jgi:exodeoxyribonuclease VII small subunit
MVEKMLSSKKGSKFMADKKNKEVDLSKLSYAQLEEEANKTLERLNKDDLPLDEASLVYEYGKKISAEMEKRLSELENSVSDTINRG